MGRAGSLAIRARSSEKPPCLFTVAGSPPAAARAGSYVAAASWFQSLPCGSLPAVKKTVGGRSPGHGRCGRCSPGVLLCLAWLRSRVLGRRSRRWLSRRCVRLWSGAARGLTRRSSRPLLRRARRRGWRSSLPRHRAGCRSRGSLRCSGVKASRCLRSASLPEQEGCLSNIEDRTGGLTGRKACSCRQCKCTYRSRARAYPARQYNTIQQAIRCTE